MEDAEYQIQNTVLTLSYKGVEFDLNRLSRELRESEYEPEVYPGLVYRMEEYGASFLLFATGKANCVGRKALKMRNAR